RISISVSRYVAPERICRTSCHRSGRELRTAAPGRIGERCRIRDRRKACRIRSCAAASRRTRVESKYIGVESTFARLLRVNIGLHCARKCRGRYVHRSPAARQHVTYPLVVIEEEEFILLDRTADGSYPLVGDGMRTGCAA